MIKILESVIRDNLSNYLSDNNLLSPNQHGFIPRRSCCTQLLHALNNWTLSLGEHLSTDVIYFDFSKAFDSVPHTRLLLKLQAYEINGQLLNWFKNFQICTQLLFGALSHITSGVQIARFLKGQLSEVSKTIVSYILGIYS